MEELIDTSRYILINVKTGQGIGFTEILTIAFHLLIFSYILTGLLLMFIRTMHLMQM